MTPKTSKNLKMIKKKKKKKKKKKNHHISAKEVSQNF